MLCPCRTTLNAGAAAASLPLPHHVGPSRAAGSFIGQLRRFDFAAISALSGLSASPKAAVHQLSVGMHELLYQPAWCMTHGGLPLAAAV